MNARATDAYLARFQKVLAYIDANLSDDLTVARLSEVAAFSMHHFLRQFSELFGIGVYKYVQLCRLKRASYQLAFRDDRTVTDIALDSGYDNAESFSRAFKKSAGQTPSEFRKQPQWELWRHTYEPLTALRTRYMQTEPFHRDIRIEHSRKPALPYWNIVAIPTASAIRSARSLPGASSIICTPADMPRSISFTTIPTRLLRPIIAWTFALPSIAAWAMKSQGS